MIGRTKSKRDSEKTRFTKSYKWQETVENHERPHHEGVTQHRRTTLAKQSKVLRFFFLLKISISGQFEVNSPISCRKAK